MRLPALLLLACSAVAFSGCAGYSLVEPGDSVHSGLRISTSQAWNRAPGKLTPLSRGDSRVWTQDGILLDRLLIIPAVPVGEPIFKKSSDDQALPVFRAGLNPKEIEELTESSITKLFGEGEVSVETSGLRPHRFGPRRGFLFDLTMAVNDGPDYGGVAGAFVADDELYVMIFLGAKPYYYEKHRQEALAVIRGASLTRDGLLGS